MYGQSSRMTHKERVQSYFAMLITSPGLIKIKGDDDVSTSKAVKEFTDACFAAALAIDAQFEKMNLEE
jgi:hypothetical protein